MTSPRATTDLRPQVGIDVQPKLLAGALRRVLSQKGWTVVDLSDHPDHLVDIVLITEGAERRSTTCADTSVIVLPGVEDSLGLARYDGRTERMSTGRADQVEQILAALRSDSL